MMTATGQEPDFKTVLSSGRHQILADMKLEKGGQDVAMGPHEILEAAMAACMSITLRMAGQKHEIPLGQTRVTVELDRSDDEIARFRYQVHFDAVVPQDQRQRLIEVLGRCPLSKTISRQIVMQAV